MSNYYRPTHNEAQGPQQLQSVTQPWSLPELSVYITDSCSLSCHGCISYNNYALGGHLALTDTVKERISTWARLVSVDRIYVIGGEPLSHPDLVSWMQFLEQLWPSSRWTIVTNGRGLERRTAEVQAWIEQGWDLEISSHTQADFDSTQAWWGTLIADMLVPTVARRQKDHMGITDYWEDSEGRPVMQIGLRDHFYAATHTVKDGRITWNKLTSARSSHNLCPAKNCTHLVDGRMYSCPVQATAPRLAERYSIEGPAGELAQKDLGYDPLVKNRQSLSSWMATLNQPKSQCSLCQWPRPLEALADPTVKKVKLVKRVSPSSPTIALAHPANLDGDEHLPTASSQA
jgi:hypothetical protein